MIILMLHWIFQSVLNVVRDVQNNFNSFEILTYIYDLGCFGVSWIWSMETASPHMGARLCAFFDLPQSPKSYSVGSLMHWDTFYFIYTFKFQHIFFFLNELIINIVIYDMIITVHFVLADL